MSVVAVDTLIDVDALVPDGIEPIEQYRVWNWNGNNLVSLNNTPWVPQKALSASCEGVHERWEYVLVRGAGWGLDVLRERAQERKAMEDRLFTSSTYYFGPPTFFPPVPSVEPPPGHGYELRPIRHDAPAESCSCGIYAAASETHDYSNQGTVYGKVKMWGKIVPGEKGVRADVETARPRHHLSARHRHRVLDRTCSLAAAHMVAQAGALHPHARISRLAQTNRLARPPILGPRRNANRHTDMGVGRATLVSARPRRRHTPATALRRLADLASERSPVRRQPVAEQLPTMRTAVTA